MSYLEKYESLHLYSSLDVANHMEAFKFSGKIHLAGNIRAANNKKVGILLVTKHIHAQGNKES